MSENDIVLFDRFYEFRLGSRLGGHGHAIAVPEHRGVGNGFAQIPDLGSEKTFHVAGGQNVTVPGGHLEPVQHRKDSRHIGPLQGLDV